MKTIDFALPSYYACYFINGDRDGLTEDELTILDSFIDNGVKNYGTFYCINANVEDSLFCGYNDLPGMSNIGSDICKYTFVIKF